ncbi:MAG: hypothetical protein BRC27_01815 [Nanohaloarchaea archaeon SW_10_44_10]|nr:MAG: hypothetical protein BRC27_01815 [Nanohaloarchaea archaeon SW_10_44_10]
MKKKQGKISKGQINIEFLAAAGLFLIAIVGLITSSSVLPQYSSSAENMDLYLEAKTFTEQLITEEGRHSFGGGGENWEKNSSTIENIEAVGIASDYHVIERSKLDTLQTATVGGNTGLNYSEFKNITRVENQYRFNFVWLPTVQTNYSFQKTQPPSNPDITEPKDNPYAAADNTVHYGSVDLDGSTYNMLVTSHQDIYDSLYVEEGNWNFSNSNSKEPYTPGEKIVENDFYVENFQNRENDRGSLVIIRRKIKDFGPTVNRDTEVTTFDRFAVLEGEPVRIEVTAW